MNHSPINHWQLVPRIALIFLLLLWSAYLSLVNGIMEPIDGWTLVLVTKVLIEVIASVFAIFYLFVALHYRTPAQTSETTELIREKSGTLMIPKRIGIIYLCCNDLDKDAVESILSCKYDHLVKLIVHDDSSDNESISEINRFVEEMRQRYDIEIILMRRSIKNGGKPGALNNIFATYHKEFDYFFICDSDSYIIDREFLNKSLCHFSDPNVALVQLRNIGITKKEDSVWYKLLSLSIDYYDTFTSFLSKFGWTPFLGHNALIKSEVIEKVGWFSPDQFADDIDYSVKLYLNGYRIVYARDVVCAEKHPETYRALRKRTHKWSLGCTQILRKWSWSIVWSDKVTFNEKVTFFLTVGYYPLQTLLFLYLFIFYLILPFNDRIHTNWVVLGIYAIFILFFTFFPSFTFFLRNRKVRDWFKVAPLWGLIYGSQDFVVAKALFSYVLRPAQKRIWEPTNSSLSRNKEMNLLGILEIIFGLCIVLVPALINPILIMLPTTILFSVKFICIPVLHQFFQKRA